MFVLAKWILFIIGGIAFTLLYAILGLLYDDDDDYYKRDPYESSRYN